ncbi:MAG: DUF2911 domain-containing protein [Nonlabens sp.]
MRLLSMLAFYIFSNLSYGQSAPDFNVEDRLSPLDVVIQRDDNGAAVTRVIYSRPSKRSREIFGNLVPYKQVWRTGANEATEIEFYKDVKIQDQLIPAGTYSIYTIPYEDSWTFIINQATTQWGTQYDQDLDVARFQIPTYPSPDTIESFSISLVENAGNKATLFMGWDDTISACEFEIVSQ